MEIAWNHGSKELMEEKQLNFNQPLLSVRRFSPAVTSEKEDKRKTKNSLQGVPRPPPYKSELKSGPVSNPGAVPFLWEQKPGRPKEEIKPQTQYSDKPPIVPRLPPGRSTKANQQDSDRVSATANAIESQLHNATHDSQSVPNVLDRNKKFENFEEKTEEVEHSDSDDDEDAYVDALDTLSRTESFFVNCSVSGLSGFDDLEMKPSASFSTDPQLHEFMMGRFLPAAQAMASETPEHVSRKQPVTKKQPLVHEQPKQIKKNVTGNKPLLRYGPSFANRYSYHNNGDDDGNGDEESDDDYSQGGNLPAVCGLLPRFCLKSSLCLLNPVPAMSVRTRVPRSPASRIQARSSSTGSFSGTENESNSDTSLQKSAGEVEVDEAIEDKTSMKNQFSSNKQQSKNLNGSILRRPLDGDSTPQSIYDEKVVVGIPEETKNAGISDFGEKGYKSFGESLSDQSTLKELDSGSPVEKTLYVDTVQQVESPIAGFSLSSKQGIEAMSKSGEKNYEIISKSSDQVRLVQSSRKDINTLDSVDKGAKLPETLKSGDFTVVPSIHKSNWKEGTETIISSGDDQDVCQYSNASKSLDVNENEAIENLQKQPMQTGNLRSSCQSHLQFPAPPPLPKSPSDSWLCRTLPTMSKSSTLRSYLGTTTYSQNQGLKAQTGDPKLETMVKTTKEQLTPIPET